MKKKISAEVEVGCGVLTITFRAGKDEKESYVVRAMGDLLSNKTPEISETNINFHRCNGALVPSDIRLIIYV